MEVLKFLCVGLAAGVLSGLFGVGGGIVIVPALAMLFGYSQAQASGTSLVAMLLPVGALGVWQYLKEGKIGGVEVRGGLLIALGLFAGAYFGGRLAVSLPEVTARKAFALLMVAAAARLWWTAK